MTIKAIYEDGVFKPVAPVPLPDKAEVDVVFPRNSAVRDGATDDDAAKEEEDHREIMEVLSTGIVRAGMIWRLGIMSISHDYGFPRHRRLGRPVGLGRSAGISWLKRPWSGWTSREHGCLRRPRFSWSAAMPPREPHFARTCAFSETNLRKRDGSLNPRSKNSKQRGQRISETTPVVAGIVDHISFAVMRRLGIADAFTNDRHFKAAGFNTLF